MIPLRQLEGRNPVLEALRIPGRVKKAFISQAIKKDDRVREILSLAGKQKVPVYKVGPKRLSRRSKTGIHQGVIAYADYPEAKNLKFILNGLFDKGKMPFLLIIVGATYEQNLGAIIRTGEVAGVDAIILPKRIDPYTPMVSRASMGAVEYIPIIQEGLLSAVKTLKKQAIAVVGMDHEAQKSVWQTDFKGPLALIVGAEDQGISQTLKDKCDQLVKIPMFGKINSLNMSVAAGVVIFETLRQRKM